MENIRKEREEEEKTVDLVSSRWEQFWNKRKDHEEKWATRRDQANQAATDFMKKNRDGTLGEGQTGILSGKSGGANFQAFTRGLLQGMPFGGLIGFLLLGEIKRQEFEASGNIINLAFDDIGKRGKDLNGVFGSMQRSLDKMSIGGKADLEAVGSAFASAGIKAEDMMKNVFGKAKGERGGPTNMLRDSLAGITFSMDKVFNMAAGTGAKALSGSIRDIGQDIAKTSQEFVGFSLAYSDLGVKGSLLVNTFSEVTSALRLQRSSMEGTLPMFGALLGNKGGGIAPEANLQHRQQMAAQGMTGMAGAVGGMRPGLSALFGEKIFGKQGIDAVIGWQEGFANMKSGDTKGDGFFAKAAGGISKWLSDTFGKDTNMQKWGAQKALGVDPLTARAFVAFAQGAAENKSSNKTAAQKRAALNTLIKQLNTDMKDRQPLKVADFLREQKKLQVLLQKIASSLLQFLMKSLDLIATTLMGILMVVSDPTRTDGRNRKIAKHVKGRWITDSFSMEKDLKTIWNNAAEIPGVAEDMVKDLGGMSGGSFQGVRGLINLSKPSKVAKAKRESQRSEIRAKLRNKFSGHALTNQELDELAGTYITPEGGEAYGGKSTRWNERTTILNRIAAQRKMPPKAKTELLRIGRLKIAFTTTATVVDDGVDKTEPGSDVVPST
jgi:hypothetical protein